MFDSEQSTLELSFHERLIRKAGIGTAEKLLGTDGAISDGGGSDSPGELPGLKTPY